MNFETNGAPYAASGQLVLSPTLRFLVWLQ